MRILTYSMLYSSILLRIFRPYLTIIFLLICIWYRVFRPIIYTLCYDNVGLMQCEKTDLHVNYGEEYTIKPLEWTILEEKIQNKGFLTALLYIFEFLLSHLSLITTNKILLILNDFVGLLILRFTFSCITSFSSIFNDYIFTYLYMVPCCSANHVYSLL